MSSCRRNSITFFAQTLFIGFLATIAASPTAAYESFDFDQRYLIQPGFIIKDHTVVELDGTYHIFYIKADETLSEGERAKALGHATSQDLAHWEFHPDVIPVVPESWEENFVWAPHVLRENGLWYMFYTGVNRNYAQAIGLATSEDLFTWTKSASNPVYIPDTSWALWEPGSWSNCRDPFVFQDGGQWHMLTTVWTNNYKGAISHATSSNLIDWNDEGPLLVHPGPDAWHVLESPNLHYVDRKYHLFFTEQNIGGTSYLMSSDLAGSWDYSAREPFDPGHAVELYKIDKTWMLSRHDAFSFQDAPVYVVKFDTLKWEKGRMPTVEPFNPLDAWTVVSGNAFDLQPTFWDNSAARGAESANFGGNSWIGTYEAYTGPLHVGEPGDAAGNEPVGVLRSRNFRIKGNRISFRIGGGNDLDNLHLTLYDDRRGTVLRRATGTDSEGMTEVVWDVSSARNKKVYLEIVDASTGEWGHINVDEIVEYVEESGQKPGDVVTVPSGVLLHGNIPNPFNPATTIRLELLRAGDSRLKIFDARGQLVRTLIQRLPAGHHDVVWDGRFSDGRSAPSGLYFYRLQQGTEISDTRSMLLLK